MECFNLNGMYVVLVTPTNLRLSLVTILSFALDSLTALEVINLTILTKMTGQALTEKIPEKTPKEIHDTPWHLSGQRKAVGRCDNWCDANKKYLTSWPPAQATRSSLCWRGGRRRGRGRWSFVNTSPALGTRSVGGGGTWRPSYGTETIDRDNGEPTQYLGLVLGKWCQA